MISLPRWIVRWISSAINTMNFFTLKLPRFFSFFPSLFDKAFLKFNIVCNFWKYYWNITFSDWNFSHFIAGTLLIFNQLRIDNCQWNILYLRMFHFLKLSVLSGTSQFFCFFLQFFWSLYNSTHLEFWWGYHKFCEFPGSFSNSMNYSIDSR